MNAPNAKNAAGARTEHYCKEIGDLDKVLSIPYEPVEPNLTAFHEAAAKLQVLAAQGIARRAANGGTRAAGDGDPLPGRRRRLLLAADDLDAFLNRRRTHDVTPLRPALKP